MKSPRPILVTFRDFWPGFDPYSNPLLELLRRVRSQVEVVSSREQSDVDFYSVFTRFGTRTNPIPFTLARLWTKFGMMDRSDLISRQVYGYRTTLKKTNAKRVWFTTELQNPPLGQFDLTLSFEKTSISEGNLYFPFWMYRLNWGFFRTWSEISPTPEVLTKPRKVESRILSAVMFSTNRDPFRLAIADLLEARMPVAKFGRAFSKPIDSKISSSLPYLLQICPENSIYPGYITEKLVEAWACGCVPIWRGGMTDPIFNRAAFIDVTGQSPVEAVETIMSYSMGELQQMRELPLMNNIPTLDELLEGFQRLLNGT